MEYGLKVIKFSPIVEKQKLQMKHLRFQNFIFAFELFFELSLYIYFNKK